MIRHSSAALRVLFAASMLTSGCREPSGPGSGLHEVWFGAQPGFPSTYSRPEVWGDVVLMGAPDGYVYWRNLRTGEVQRAARVCGAGGPQGRRFARTAEILAVACHDEIVAISLSSGMEAWRYDPPRDTTYDGLPGYLGGTYPLGADTVFYVPAWGASVSALSASTGLPLWVWRIGRLPSDTAANVFRSGAAGVALSGDTVFVSMWHFTNRAGGTSEALLVALHRETGEELWRLALPVPNGAGSVSAPPVLVDDLALFLTTNGRIFAVRRSTQQIAWQYRSPAFAWSTTATPVVVGDVVYASTGDDRLTALSVKTGAVLWAVETLGATQDLLATAARIYVPNYGRISVHDLATGALVARGGPEGEDQTFTTGAAASSGQIFITSSAGAWSFREP